MKVKRRPHTYELQSASERYNSYLFIYLVVNLTILSTAQTV